MCVPGISLQLDEGRRVLIPIVSLHGTVSVVFATAKGFAARCFYHLVLNLIVFSLFRSSHAFFLVFCAAEPPALRPGGNLGNPAAHTATQDRVFVLVYFSCCRSPLSSPEPKAVWVFWLLILLHRAVLLCSAVLTDAFLPSPSLVMSRWLQQCNFILRMHFRPVAPAPSLGV